MQKWYKAVSLINIISPTLNASPPALTKFINSFRKKSFGGPRNHSCTAWRTSSSERNFFPPIASLSGPNVWKSLGVRSGEYGGWGRHSKCRSVMVATVVRAVWGLASSCCKRTPDDSNPRRFDLIAGRRRFLGDLSMMHWWQWSL